MCLVGSGMESNCVQWGKRGRNRRRHGKTRVIHFCFDREAALYWRNMIRRTISYRSASPLVILGENMNFQDYIPNVLEPVASPYRQQLETPIFRQDNASPHKQHSIPRLLHRSVRSADLSFIIHITDMIGRRLSQIPASPKAWRASCLRIN